MPAPMAGRRYYTGETQQMSPHPIYVATHVAELVEQGAERTNFTTASYLRFVVERYLAQPSRVPVPAALDGKVRLTMRTHAQLWEQMGFRAQQEDRTLSALVAAAVLAEHEAHKAAGEASA